MNLENNSDYAEAIMALDQKIVDGKVYLSVTALDEILESLSQHIIDSVEDEVCPHAAQMYYYILTALSNITDTMMGLNAEALVPDTVPDDFDDGTI